MFFHTHVGVAMFLIFCLLVLFEKYSFILLSKAAFVEHFCGVLQTAYSEEMNNQVQLANNDEKKVEEIKSKYQEFVEKSSEQVFDRILFFSLVYCVFGTAVEKEAMMRTSEEEDTDTKKSSKDTSNFVSVAFLALFEKEFPHDRDVKQKEE